MIGRLTGTLAGKSPPQVMVDVGGVGYELDVPMSTFFNLPALGESVQLLTHLVVREDAHVLFGFGTAAERQAFRELIRISGVGPRTALGVLSGMSVQELARAVQLQESARLTKVPGIGKKTAERLMLELKSRMGQLAAPGALSDASAGPGEAAAAPSATSDIEQALLALGYNEREAAAALKGLPQGVGVSEGIRLALKALSK